MKTTYIKTLEKLAGLTWLKMADRDRGQIDHYEGKPQLAFPCALVNINFPKRKNLNIGGTTQMVGISITIRFAFERLYDSSSLNTPANRLKALDYLDKTEEADELLQGYSDSYFKSGWECTATLDETRPDFDIVRFTFTTSIVK